MRSLGNFSRYGVICRVTADEFQAYLRVSMYTADMSSAENMLSSSIQLLYEIVEIRVLESMWYNIDEETIVRAYPDSCYTHLGL